jgi:hypothetical protein
LKFIWWGEPVASKIGVGNQYGPLTDLETAEAQICHMGGRGLRLHAQCRIDGFYEAIGYTSTAPLRMFFAYIG